ncbi:MAG: carbohydrate-binding family 9-like protein [Terracidiphilus sp.]
MNKVVASCLFFLTGTMHASAADDSMFRSAYAAQDVALDTNTQSAFWQGATSVYMEVDIMGRPEPAYKTKVSSRWTKNYLYLLYECPYEELYLKPSPDAVNETFELWNWDVAELFIGTDFKNIRRYKEFELSPQREWIDLDVNLDLPDHTVGWTWNSGFQVTAHIDADKKIWYGAMKIPFKALDGHRPVAGKVFRANLFRSQGPPHHRKEIVWKAPMSNTFHVPENFGQLILVGDK